MRPRLAIAALAASAARAVRTSPRHPSTPHGRLRVAVAGLAAVAALVGGCSTHTEPAQSATPTSSPASTALPKLAAVQLPPPLALPPSGLSVSSQQMTYTREGRALRTVIWTPDRPGRYPAVIFSHGLNGAPEEFAPLLKTWAQAGFVVIAPAYPNTTRGAPSFDLYDVLNQPADASFVLGQVLGGPVGQHIDAHRLAAAGHSAGAITTVGLFTAARDPRLRAGVILAGSGLGVGTDFTGSPAALFFVHGDADPMVSYESGKATYDLVPWAKAMLTIPGGNHNDPYLQPGSAAYQTVATSTLEFLRLELYGDQDARASLAPSTDLDSHL
ncbi:alpha/beta hydrolase family protein [Dactylosporangium sp. CA-139066]|uniref:alpha/beta hydrolase family protein n=1 Tax=Dactylosporangium sp. CA-139066 TaxID=3239930 RepID=UPI003D8C26C8